MTKRKFPISITSLITAVVMVTISGYILIGSVKSLDRNYIEDDWKITKGVILSPNLKLEGKKNIERSTQGFVQTINYEYEINGRTYQSNSASKESYVLPDQFPEGKVVDVYYNPTDVTDTVLVRSAIQKHYIYVVIAFCALIIGVIFFCLIKDFRN